jgi:hypothetical protein
MIQQVPTHETVKLILTHETAALSIQEVDLDE